MGHDHWPGGRIIVTVCALALILAVIIALIGGCGESIKDRQEAYRSQYVKIIDAFQAKVAKDDAAAEKLVKGTNLAGLIKLNNERIKNINETFDQVVTLVPPADLRKVHADTLYYLMSLVDQMQAQIAYAEAVLVGKPSNDLQQINQSAAARTQQLGGELGLELQKANIVIKAAPVKQSQPESSAPTSSPGGSSK